MRHGMTCEDVHIYLERVLILLVKQEGEFWRQGLFSLNCMQRVDMLAMRWLVLEVQSTRRTVVLMYNVKQF